MTGRGSAGWRLSDLVHVLAQLPASARLELEADTRELARIRPLCRAYALGDRVGQTEAKPGRAGWRFEGIASGAPDWEANDSLESLPETMGELVEFLWLGEEAPAAAQKDDQILNGHRIAIVTNLPAHYRIPLFTGLAQRLAGAGASLRVFFLGAGEPDRPWLRGREDFQFEHEFMRSIRLPVRPRRAPFLPFDLRGRLGAYEPTIVLAAGFSPFSTVEAALYARRRRIPFGIWSGETPSHAPRGRRQALQRSQRGWLTRRAAFGIGYGSLAVRYLRSLAPDLPVVVGRNTSVTETKSASRRRDGSILELVAVADISVPGKGIETVIEALQLSKELPCRLKVIGGRPQGGSPLEASASRDDRVLFTGPLPHEEVIAAYGESDVFLFPTRVDPFGHALVEAMASEVAAIVSPAAGAAADLAVSGHNCLVAEVDSPMSWAKQIATLEGDDELRRSLALRGRQTVGRRWTMAHAVDGMIAGLRLGAFAAEGAA